MLFRDRKEAAHLLARELLQYKDQNPLIVAIPRGAVSMALELSHILGGDLDVVLVHKLGAPDNPEYAIGSIDETGYVILGEEAKDVSADYVTEEKQKQLAVLRHRRALYTPVRAPIDPAGRTVIIVDDGIATGSTMIAAIQAIAVRKPEKIIVATPVAARDALRKISAVADAVLCLYAPMVFLSVGQFYAVFPQVSDEEVVGMLGGGRI